MTTPATAQARASFLLSFGAVLDDSGESVLHFGDAAGELSAFSGAAALVDRSSGSAILHEGADALDLLHRLSTNDLLQLEPGQSAFTVLTSERGRIIDVLNVAVIEKDRLLLVSESPDPGAAVNWIDRFTIIEDSTVRDASDELARLALIGPAVYSIANTAFSIQLTRGAVAGLTGEHDGAVLVASVWGELERVDLVMPVSRFEQLWEALSADGAVPAGDLAFHAARIAQGVPFSGSELSDRANPLEAGLKELISFTKGCYIGQEVVARLDTYDKVQKRLAILDYDEPLTPGAPLSSDGKRAGVVTSVSALRGHGAGRALGYVRRDFWTEGTRLSCGDSVVTVKRLSDIPVLG